MATSNENSGKFATESTVTASVLLVTIGIESAQSISAQTNLANALSSAGFSVSPVRVADASETPAFVSSLKHTIVESEADQHSKAASDHSSIKLAVLHQPEAIEPAETLPESLVSQLAAALQCRDVPIIAATTSDWELCEHLAPATLPFDSKSRGYQTVSIRSRYREHDQALLIRQILSILKLKPSSKLSAYPVPPVKLAGAVALERQQLQQQINALIPDWTLSISDSPTDEPATALTRKLKFRSFQAAIQYMHMVAPACDVANHHPRWENNWRSVHIDLTTWDAKQQVTERDTRLAHYFDYVYTAFGFRT